MKIAHLHVRKGMASMTLALGAILIAGCSPTDTPLDTIVMGEQVTADGTDSPGEENSSSGGNEPLFTIDSIIVDSYLVQGQPSAMTISCTAHSPDSVVQSVTLDLSALGGPQQLRLTMKNGKWVWSGIITATIAGSATLYFTAIDETGTVTTAETPVTVDPAPTLPSGDDTSSPIGSSRAPGQVGDNIALGCPYTWDMPPTFPFCTDAGDQTQLTDGLQASRLFTNDTAWVGWKANRKRAWVAITIDLGYVQPIQGASFSTIACVDGQEWPLAICILTSNDNISYYHAGELTSLSAEYGLPAYTTSYERSRIVHSYQTNRLATQGRYVRIVVANYPQIFVDEIEIIRGQDSLLDTPLAGTPVTDLAAYVENHKVRSGIIRRIVLDCQNVLSEVQQADSFAGQANLEADLRAIIEQAVQLNGAALQSEAEALHWPQAGDPTQFRTILPLNSLHRQVFRAQAALWRARRDEGLVAWQTPRWDSISVHEAPGISLPSIDVTLMQNEYRADAFNLSNATDSDLTVTLRIHDLPGGTNPNYITVHAVPWTDTQRGVPVAAALPKAIPQDGALAVRVPAGMTTQVWLTFHPTDVAAGIYNGIISVAGDTTATAAFPVRLRISSLRFPDQPTLSLGGWDNTDMEESLGLTLHNRDQFVAHLRSHYVDAPWGTAHSMWPKPVPTDPMQRQDYYRLFDGWVARWQDQTDRPALPVARKYYIHMMDTGATFDGYPAGSPQFDAAIGQWIRDWADHWQSLGMDPNQIALLIADEPDEPKEYERITAWGSAIRAAGTGAQVWQTQILPSPYVPNSDPPHLQQHVQDIFDVVDVLCPNRVTFMTTPAWRAVHRQQRDAGKPLHFYSCLGPSQWLDPYSYHRLQAWTCWAEGATAMFYWSFRDNGHVTGDSEAASSWNEYLAKWNYSPLFLDDTTVTAGKHMEAIREGVEDYEYLLMLSNQIATLKADGNPPPEVAEAEILLNAATNRVLEAPGDWFWPEQKFAWTRQIDRRTADQVRIEILDMLEILAR